MEYEVSAQISYSRKYLYILINQLFHSTRQMQEQK